MQPIGQLTVKPPQLIIGETLLRNSRKEELPPRRRELGEAASADVFHRVHSVLSSDAVMFAKSMNYWETDLTSNHSVSPHLFAPDTTFNTSHALSISGAHADLQPSPRTSGKFATLFTVGPWSRPLASGKLFFGSPWNKIPCPDLSSSAEERSVRTWGDWSSLHGGDSKTAPGEAANRSRVLPGRICRKIQSRPTKGE